MKKTNLFYKIYNRKLFWMVVSLLASVILWIFITGEEMEEYRRTFPGVKVELVGESSLRDMRNLVITDLDTNTVTVELVGPRRIIASMNAADLTAEVNVGQLMRSAYTSQRYDLVFPDGTDSSKITINRQTPEVVNFMVSEITKKSIPVSGSFDGSLAPGFMGETAEFEPATITVSGPEIYLKNIDRAWVSFAKEDVSSTYEVETGFVLLNKEGEECSTKGLSFSTDTVIARLPINEIKDIPLSVDVIEGAGAVAANTKISIEPKYITLSGDSAMLAGLNKISLATIDLTDFASTFSDTYKIVFNDELSNLSGITEATVNVEVVGLTTREFKISASNLSYINVTEGYTADILSEGLTVLIRGTEEQLNAIRSENLRAVADLVDYDESVGSYNAPVKIYVDGFTDVGAVGKYTILIELGKA